jgi:hypothetical protein
VPPHSPVELAEGTSSPLALALHGALVRNEAKLGKLEGTVLVRAEDTDSSVTLDFTGGHVRVADGEPESAQIRILGDEDAILALTRLPYRRLPKLGSPAGREVLKRQLGGELTIRGLVLRSRSVLRLLRLLAA